MSFDLKLPIGRTDLQSDEYVLPALAAWQKAGAKCALVTLLNIEGGAPRQVGAQMAICENGDYVGYLSGGCLESAVVVEAQAAIVAGSCRIVRYGKGSPYFDIRLPCGSGLDVYIDPTITLDTVAEIIDVISNRQLCDLEIDLLSGQSHVVRNEQRLIIEPSRRDGEVFRRSYSPNLRLVVAGHGPAVSAMASLATIIGFDVTIVSRDPATVTSVQNAGLSEVLSKSDAQTVLKKMDYATAAILLFHDHNQEPELLAAALDTNAFYIGALGNRAVHRARLMALSGLGVAHKDAGRIRAPLGLIAGAKTKATVAMSALSEVIAEAKARNLIA